MKTAATVMMAAMPTPRTTQIMRPPFPLEDDERVNEEAVKWLREQVQARLEAARACQSPSPWKAATHESDTWIITDATGEVVVYDEGTPSLQEAAHIALNDPRDVIARCEAELAVLGLLRSATEDFTHITENAYEFSRREALEQVVAVVASGYKHREGYAEHWGG